MIHIMQIEPIIVSVLHYRKLINVPLLAGPYKIFPCVSGGTSDRDLDPLQNATMQHSPGGTSNEYVNLKSPDPAYVNLQVSLNFYIARAHCALRCAHNIARVSCMLCAAWCIPFILNLISNDLFVCESVNL